jgi:hypothetical protein
MPQIFGLDLSDKKSKKFGTRADKKSKARVAIAMRAKERVEREKKNKKNSASKAFKFLDFN